MGIDRFGKHFLLGILTLVGMQAALLAQEQPRRWDYTYNTIRTGQEIVAAAHQLTIPVEELLSWNFVRQRLAERWFEEHQEELLQQIESGEPVQQIRTIEAVCLWVSPWQRGQTRAKRNSELMELVRIERPVMRPVNHPAAAKLRGILMKIHAENRQEIAGQLFAENNLRSSLVVAAEKLLLEIANVEVSAYFSQLLLREEIPYRGTHWFACLETIHGLPPTFRFTGICGHCSKEEIKRHSEQERRRYVEQRTALLTWLEHLSQLTETERLSEILPAWLPPEEDRARVHPPSLLGKNGWDTQNLVRLGPAMVPVLRQEQKKQQSVDHQADLELVIAAITGQSDEQLVRELLSRDGFSEEQGKACNIIQQAGDQRFRGDMVKLLQDPKTYYTVRDRAAEALAILDRKAVLPLLRKSDQESMTHLVKWLEFHTQSQ